MFNISCQFVPVFMYVSYQSDSSFLSSLLHHGHFLVFYQIPHLTIKCINKPDLLSFFHHYQDFLWKTLRLGYYTVILHSGHLELNV